MNKKIIWLIVSCLMVVALVLLSCGPEPVTEKEEVEGVVTEPEKKEEEVEEVEEVVGPAVGELQYGGTITVFHPRLVEDPPSPDIKEGDVNQMVWLFPIMEMPLQGDFEKFGPRGTGEYAFDVRTYIPEQFLGGVLLESWEVSPDLSKLIWHVRPGIMWQDNPYLGFDFEPRELTAADMVSDLLDFRESPAGKPRIDGFAGDIYATDKYTLVIEFTKFTTNWIYLIGYEDRNYFGPPELLADDEDDWMNQVGTGPFMIKEYVVGSHMTYVRNPNYWKKTLIDGVEYEYPFVDEMIQPIIPDESTQMAALRTGKIDYFYHLPPIHWDSLETLAPELLSTKVVGADGGGIWLRCNEPPFDNLKLRQAMMIGTDLRALALLETKDPAIHPFYPIRIGNPDPPYTPMEDLPASIQKLYTYSPDLAMEMLEDVLGPPDANGIYLKTNLYAMSEPMPQDRASLIKYQWAKIGVDATIITGDRATWGRWIEPPIQYHGAVLAGIETANPLMSLATGRTGQWMNTGRWSDPLYDAMMDELVITLDIAEQNLLAKEANLYLLGQGFVIPTNLPPEGAFYWPWVKNYFGEYNVADYEGIAPILATIWIDQALKAKMGY